MTPGILLAGKLADGMPDFWTRLAPKHRSNIPTLIVRSAAHGWTVPVHQLVTHELRQRNEPAVKFAFWVPSWTAGWKKQWVC